MYDHLAFICTTGGCTDIVLFYYVLLPLLIIVTLSVIIYLVVRFGLKKKHSFGKVFGITLGVATLLVLIFGVIPVVVEDRAREQKSWDCAREVGYEAPWENNSHKATAESQAAYRECMNR